MASTTPDGAPALLDPKRAWGRRLLTAAVAAALSVAAFAAAPAPAKPPPQPPPVKPYDPLP